MHPEVDVYLQRADEAVHVGTLYANARMSRLVTTFVYGDVYVARPDAFPLCPHMPLPQRQFSGESIPALFSDAAPDRWGRRLIEKAHPGEALDDESYLLYASDVSRQGALRFSLPGSRDFLDPSASIPKLISLPDLLYAAQEANANPGAIKELLDAGTSSLGGANPKASVLDDDGNLCIAKFSYANAGWHAARWEMTALDVAQSAGISVPEHSLHRFKDVGDALVTRRFDRRGGRRIHYMSALTLLDARDMEAHDYLEVLEGMQRLEAAADIDEMLARMTLTCALNNADDHLRNHGFLHDGRGWRLSPLFDVNPDPHAGRAHALSMCGDESAIRAENLKSCMEYMGRSGADMRQIVTEVLGAVRDVGKAARRNRCPQAEQDAMFPVVERNVTQIKTTFA